MIVYPVAFIIGLFACKSVRSRTGNYIFIIATIIFIGSRYKTGFDWPVYQRVWFDLANDFNIYRIFTYDCFAMEKGFIALFGGMAIILPRYEYAQLIFTLVFIISCCYLIYIFQPNKMAMVLSIILSYIMFTVGFSVVRQSLSIAVFNFGLAAHYRDKKYTSAFLMTISILFQVTSVLYVASFLVANLSKRFLSSKYNFYTLFGIFFSAIIASIIFIFLVLSFPQYVPSKILYYIEVNKFYYTLKSMIWSVFLCSVFGLIGFHAALTSDNTLTEKQSDLKRLIVVHAALAAGALFVPIVRERVSYELWILYSVFLSLDSIRFRREAIIAAFGFGAVFSALLFRYPNRLMFLPYQNFIFSKIFDLPSTAGTRATTFYSVYEQKQKKVAFGTTGGHSTAQSVKVTPSVPAAPSSSGGAPKMCELWTK